MFLPSLSAPKLRESLMRSLGIYNFQLGMSPVETITKAGILERIQGVPNVESITCGYCSLDDFSNRQ